MAVNDLDFIYASSPGGGMNATAVSLSFDLDFTGFFPNGGSHIPLVGNIRVIDPPGFNEGTLVYRNGELLFSYGRGFLIVDSTDTVIFEHWDGTYIGTETVAKVEGAGFNPDVDTNIHVVITNHFGNALGSLANECDIAIYRVSDGVLLYRGVTTYSQAVWGWEQEDFYNAGVGAIGPDFEITQGSNVEPSRTGGSPSAGFIVKNLVVTYVTN